MSDARAQMTARIRASLQINGVALETQSNQFLPPHPHGPFVQSSVDAIEQFRLELTSLHSSVHVCDGAEEAIDQVIKLLLDKGMTTVLTWAPDQLPLADLGEHLRSADIEPVESDVLGNDRARRHAELESIQACITGADAAIAESGTMLVVSGNGRGRLASLLPPMHIAILPADRIRRTLPDAFDRLREEFGLGLFKDHSNITLITGPSRTADIELSLTLGVHGPRDIHAIVVR
ncbi:MAG: lactate utilization protein [Herpetosiphon sp.]